MNVSPARRAALRALARVRQREAYAPETLAAVLSETRLSAEDTALATRLTYGTLQAVGVLDEAIDRVTDKPGGVEPQVRDALRLGAFEILFMRTPSWAAVNEAVDAVRRARPRAAGLANAVLRRLADEAGSFPWGDPGSDDEALARLTGHPVWMVRLLLADLGRETARAVLADANEPAPLYVWRNPFIGSMDEAMAALGADGADPVAFEPEGCIVAGNPGAAVRGGAVADGRVLVTDAAAQLAARALLPRPGQVIVDLAAGRGTKTAEIQALAVEAGGAADVTAVDIHEFKARVLSERMSSLGVPGVRVIVGDATDVASIEGMPPVASADAVLVDAPCSGLGTLRRRPDRRWRLKESDVDALPALQGALLRQAALLVRPGGVVVYSTCSLARRENHDVVSGFLGEGPGSAFRIRSAADVVPLRWSAWVGPEGHFQSIPRSGGPDGHFVAVLERKG